MASNEENLIVFDNYQSTLWQSFGDMFNKDELTDAILLCENRKIRVHKILLSAMSPFFDRLFAYTVVDHILPINYVKYDDLFNVLEYVYNGRVSIPLPKLKSFVATACAFSIAIPMDVLKRLRLEFDDGETSDDRLRLLMTEAMIDDEVARNVFLNNDVDSAIGLCQYGISSTNADKTFKIPGVAATETIYIEKPIYGTNCNKNVGFRNKKTLSTNNVVKIDRETFFKELLKLKNRPWPLFGKVGAQETERHSETQATVVNAEQSTHSSGLIRFNKALSTNKKENVIGHDLQTKQKEKKLSQHKYAPEKKTSDTAPKESRKARKKREFVEKQRLRPLQEQKKSRQAHTIDQPIQSSPNGLDQASSKNVGILKEVKSKIEKSQRANLFKAKQKQRQRRQQDAAALEAPETTASKRIQRRRKKRKNKSQVEELSPN